MQSNQPHTFVVVTLDPPIRKGQTLYPHIVLQVICRFHCISMGSYQKKKNCISMGFLLLLCSYHMIIFILAQFETDYVVDSTLSINDDLLNTKYKDKLDPSYKVCFSFSYY